MLIKITNTNMANKTNFDKVIDFNTQFGILTEAKPFTEKVNILETEEGLKLVDFCLKLIKEEYKELEDAISTSDFIEVADALADLIYVIFGMLARLGIDFNENFNRVIDSPKTETSEEDNTNEFSDESSEDSYSVSHKNFLTYNDKLSEFDKIIISFIQRGILYDLPPFKSKFHIFDNDIEIVEDYMKVSDKIMNELEDAIKLKDFKELKNIIIGLPVLFYSIAIIFGINFDELFDVVHTNNMSKLCTTEQQAKDTVVLYLDNDKYDSPTYKLAPDNIHYVVYNKSTNKVLKSIAWEPVNLKGVLGIPY